MVRWHGGRSSQHFLNEKEQLDNLNSCQNEEDDGLHFEQDMTLDAGSGFTLKIDDCRVLKEG